MTIQETIQRQYMETRCDTYDDTKERFEHKKIRPGKGDQAAVGFHVLFGNHSDRQPAVQFEINWKNL